MMDIKDIKKIVELVRVNDLAELEIEEGDFRLSVVGSYAPEEGVVYSAPTPVAAAPVAAAPAVPPIVAEDTSSEDDGLLTITSPIVGTFYAAASPDADNFVKVGDTVNEDTTVCIVEAMKVMNEIKAEVKGVIRAIVADNASAVEFGQVLFKVEPA